MDISKTGQIADVGRFLQLADKYSDLQGLDAATVNELIEKIIVHNPEKIGGKKHVTIEVYFTYVGKIRIPLSKPEPFVSTEKPACFCHAGFTGNFIYFLISLCLITVPF